MMNVLDEAFYLAGSVRLGDDLADLFGSFLLVAGEGFAEHIDEGAVAGEEHGMFLFMCCGAMGDEVEAGEGLAGAWHACDKANRFVALGLCLFDDLLKTVRCFA